MLSCRPPFSSVPLDEPTGPWGHGRQQVAASLSCSRVTFIDGKQASGQVASRLLDHCRVSQCRRRAKLREQTFRWLGSLSNLTLHQLSSEETHEGQARAFCR